MEQNFKDLFSNQAQDYSRFRPSYPKALFVQLSAACKEHDLAWDVGAGNGQATVALAPHFKKVIGTEPSKKQLDQATPHPKVEYRQAPAEASTIENRSVDLITVAQAFHWFDQPKFFQEVKRVAKPDAVLAVWCYELCNITPEVDSVVMDLYQGILGSYWDNGRKLVEEGYRNEKFPFEELTAPKTTMGLSWYLADLLGYLGTWSALDKYRKEKGDPRPTIMPSLQRAWGDLSVPKTVTWPLSIRMFRIP